jgi:predicted nucleotidyltransferase
VVAVALGGSRATGTHRPDSDWDLGVYFRASQRPLDAADVRALGHDGYVSERDEWGPIMNGGAWLTIAATRIDVLYRDLDTVERWIADAEQGRFEVLTQNGYIAGAPTYVPVGELAIARPITGNLPRPSFPAPLASAAPPRWRGKASVALMFAREYARAADTVCCTGMLAQATLCEAQARMAERAEWVLNEKRLVERAGLSAVRTRLARAGASADELLATTDEVSKALEVRPLEAR